MKRLAFAALLLVAAGCGGGADHSSPGPAATPAAQEAVLEAAAKSQALTSARISIEGKITGGATEGTFTAEGGFAGDRGRMSMDMSDITNGQIRGRIDMVFDGLLFYMKFPPAIAQGLPPGKSWVKFDLAELGEESGIDIAELFQQFGGSDPSKSLDLLRAAGGDFREVGKEQVRGVETTHYAGTVDLQKLADTGGAKLRETYRRIIELTGKSRIPTDVWIDDEGLTRRMHYEQSLPDGATTEITQEFYDFGADLDVEPPPAGEAIDITELITTS